MAYRKGRNMGKRFFSRPEAAEFLSEKGLRVKKGTLAKYVSVGGGPKMYKFGHRAVYDPEDLLIWAANRMGLPPDALR